MPNSPGKNLLGQLSERFIDEVLFPFLVDKFNQMTVEELRQVAPQLADDKTRRKRTKQTPSAAFTPRVDPPQLTFYDVLQVSPRADAETIRAAWQSLVKRFHSDVNGSENAKERIRQINEAWQCLKDRNRRGAYDRALMLDRNGR